MLRRLGITIGALVAMALPASAATPRVSPGWPVVAAPGAVFGDPVGGFVLISEGTLPTLESGIGSAVASFGAGGLRRWVAAERWSCGNCDDGFAIPGPRPNGNYGLIGADGDDNWDITPAGAKVAGCNGDVLADGTCIAHERRAGAGTSFIPAVAARQGGTLLWEYTQPITWTIASSDNVPPVIVRDSVGTIYTSFGAGQDAAAAPVAAQLIALNPTGTLRWRVFDASPRLGLSSGVIATSGTSLVAYTADGVARWTAPIDPAVTVGRVFADETRNRVYVSLRSFTDPTVRQIIALDLLSGAEVWRTVPADRASVLSVGPTGLVYASIDRPTRTGVRAITSVGVGRWQFDTTTSVAGAFQAPDGTVGVSTTGRDVFGRSGGLMWRINPARPALGVRSPAFSLSRTSFISNCPTPSCFFNPTVGTVLRIASPRRTTATVRLLSLAGAVDQPGRLITVPAGVSYVRLYAGTAPNRNGRRIIEVRGVFAGRARVVRLPVRLRNG